MTKVFFNTAAYGKQEFEAEEMTKEEFDKIKPQRDTPDVVKISEEEAYYNNYTCISSYRYGGTCNCISHPTKEWIKFNPTTGVW